MGYTDVDGKTDQPCSSIGNLNLSASDRRLPGGYYIETQKLIASMIHTFDLAGVFRGDRCRETRARRNATLAALEIASDYTLPEAI